MSCMFAEYKEGYRTFSDNVPGYAQGAYFPGDEPGFYCKLSGEYCNVCDNGNPNDCQYKTKYFCPECFCNGFDHVHYLADLPQGMTCLNCGETFTMASWLECLNKYADDINAYVISLNKENEELKDKIKKLEKEIKEKEYANAGIKYAYEMLKERKTA